MLAALFKIFSIMADPILLRFEFVNQITKIYPVCGFISYIISCFSVS